MPRRAAVLVVLLYTIVCLSQQNNLQVAQTNDNRVAAGILQDGTLAVHLEIREALFAPDADDGPNVPVYAFAEEGHAPQIPGPLIRVQRNVVVHAMVRNFLPKTVYVHGFQDRPYKTGEQLVLTPGEEREITFRANAAGSYFYWASTTDCAIADRKPEDTQLSGAIIVDPPGARINDRIFVIGLWYVDPSGGLEVLTINGKSWPYTERFPMRIGDSIDWRWINPSVSDHAMHLHGFFFDVTSIGNEGKDQILDSAESRRVVTQYIPPGGTFRMHWSPERVGNWIFHCHMVAHMSPHGSMQPGSEKEAGATSHSDHTKAASGMGGLVLGISVTGEERTVVSAPTEPHRLTLVVRERPATDEYIRGYSFDMPDGKTETPDDKLPLFGKPLVLTQGEPAEITVINKLKAPTAVHWHGIELESYYDGVPGLTGNASQTTPPIQPGEAFTAKMTPPKAGTFIYHTHWHDSGQLTGGLYGALIVLEPGKKFDPEFDKVFILARIGTVPGRRKLVVNGDPQPNPTFLEAGKTYHLRLINITPNDADAVFALKDGNTPVRWKWIGKDGNMFAPTERVEEEAKQSITVGETYDFEFTPAKPGLLQLEGFAPFALQWVDAPIVVQPPKKQ